MVSQRCERLVAMAVDHRLEESQLVVQHDNILLLVYIKAPKNKLTRCCSYSQLTCPQLTGAEGLLIEVK